MRRGIEPGAGRNTRSSTGWNRPETEPPDSLPPLWLLDVDGVLNAVADEPDPLVWPEWHRGWAEAEGVDWPILFSPNVPSMIRELHEQRLVEVRWLTTWRTHANRELRRLLGLPTFAVVADGGRTPAAESADLPLSPGTTSHGTATAAYHVPGEWWKFRAVRDLVDGLGERPLIWTDDELDHQPDAVAWVRRRVMDSLLISPAPQIGLAPRDLLEVEEFCRLHTGRAGEV